MAPKTAISRSLSIIGGFGEIRALSRVSKNFCDMICSWSVFDEFRNIIAQSCQAKLLEQKRRSEQ